MTTKTRDSTVSPSGARAYPQTVALVAAATALASLAHRALALPDIAMVYLLVIMAVAVRYGRGASVLASALSVASYDLFFIPPYFTFDVHDAHNVLSFVTMFVVGQLLSELAFRIRRGEREARRRESRTAALYALTRALGEADDAPSVTRALAAQAEAVFGGSVAVHLHAAPTSERSEHEHRVTISARSEALGELVLRPVAALDDDERALADAFARQGGAALERVQLVKAAHDAALKAHTEQMRSTLLSAVSHDLRTPLAAITGAATTLREDGEGLAKAQRDDMVDTICEEAERLERLVANLLDMTRLESGAITVKREWVPLEEVVGSALTRLERRLAGRAVTTELPEALSMVSIDPVLIEQIFVNVLENAIKYTPAGSPLEIRAKAHGEGVEVTVADRGPGVPAGRESQIFERFYRGAHKGVGGVGLGLPISRGLAEAHGGTLTAHPREGGGALFRLVLPSAGPVPSLPLEEAS